MEILIFIAMALFAVWVIRLAFGRPTQETPPSTVKGSARDAVNIEQANLRPPIVIGYKNVASNAKKEKSDLIPYCGEGHLLTVGATRSGKGVGAIIPNIMQYDGSIIVIDPKGEAVEATANAREARGDDIFVIDPWNITKWQSNSYNPLNARVQTDNTIIEDARLIAQSIIVGGIDVRQSFFEEEARSVLSTAIAHMLKKNDPRDTLCSLLDIVGKKDSEVKKIYHELAASSELGGFIARGASRFIDKSAAEYSGVLSTVRQHTEFLDCDAMRDALATSDLQFRRLREARATVYLVIPVWRIPAYNRWLRLMITMALTELAQSSSSKNVPVLIIIDEFASLGILPSFDTAFGLMAGLGVQLWPILQDFTQLKRLYGESWETFVANAGVLQCFGTRDLLTASYISGRMGPGTIEIHERTMSHQGEAHHIRLDQRPLRYPDEVIKLPSSHGIAFIEHSQSIMFNKIKYYEDSNFLSADRLE